MLPNHHFQDPKMRSDSIIVEPGKWTDGIHVLSKENPMNIWFVRAPRRVNIYGKLSKLNNALCLNNSQCCSAPEDKLEFEKYCFVQNFDLLSTDDSSLDEVYGTSNSIRLRWTRIESDKLEMNPRKVNRLVPADSIAGSIHHVRFDYSDFLLSHIK